MSKGDGSNERPTLGIFGAISALVLCCFIVGVLAFSNGQETERRDKTPAAYAEAAKNKALQDCAGSEGNAAFECIYEKVEASQQQAHDKQDLTAQQKSANGTMITAALAFAGLIISVVGIGLVYTTFNETRKANDISREVMRRQLRPYIAINGMGFPITDINLRQFVVSVKNFGLGSALQIRARIHYSIDNGETWKGRRIFNIELVPTLDATLNIWLDEDDSMRVNSRPEIEPIAKFVITYSDAFNVRYRCTWIITSERKQKMIGQAGVQNQTTERQRLIKNQNQQPRQNQLNHAARLTGRWPFL